MIYRFLFLVFTGLTLLMTACSEPESDHSSIVVPSKPVRGDGVVIGILGQPTTLNPTNYFDEIAENINHHLFQRLLDRTAHPDYELIPMLAKDRPKISEDGLRYTFEIREEAHWDDGKPITAEDVIFSLKVIKNPLVNCPAKRPYFDMVQDVMTDPQNPKKFTIILRSKYMLAESSLGYELLIIPKQVYDPDQRMAQVSFDELQNAERAKNNPDVKAFAESYNQPKYDNQVGFIVGSNAYQLTEWTTKQKIVLKRKTKWWADSLYHEESLQAFPDQIIYKFYSDENAAIASVKSGKLDVLANISPKSFIELEKSDKVLKNYHLSAQPTYAYTYFGMNLQPKTNRQPFFTDKRVRRAMAHLLNAEEIIQKLLYGQAQRVVGPILPFNKSAYNDSLAFIEYDPVLAEKLLEEAGWKDTDHDGIRDKNINGRVVPFEFEFQIPAQLEIRKNVALYYQATLKKAGIKMSIAPLDMNVYFGKQDERDFDMYYGGWAASPAPLDLKQTFHSSSYLDPSGSNMVGLLNPELDQVIEALRLELNPENRSRLYRKAQKIIYEEQPYVFFLTSLTPVIIAKRFQNAEPSALRPNYQVNAFWTIPEMRKYK